jgi:hypothetical protein
MAWFDGCRSTARRIDRKRGVLGIVWPLLLLLLLVLLVLLLLVLRGEVGWIHLLANGYDRFKKEAQITD